MTSPCYASCKLEVNGTTIDVNLHHVDPVVLLGTLAQCDPRAFAGLVGREGLDWVGGPLFDQDQVASLKLMEALATETGRRAGQGDTLANTRRLHVATARTMLHTRGLVRDHNAVASDVLQGGRQDGGLLRAIVRSARQEWTALALDPAIAKPSRFVQDVDGTLDKIFHAGNGLQLFVDADPGSDVARRETDSVLAALKRLRLSRFDLVGYYDDVRRSGRVPRWMLRLLVFVPVLFIPAGGVLAGSSHEFSGAFLALCGVVVAFGLAAFRDAVTPLLCLRLPASASVGAAALMSFGPKWMKSIEIGRAGALCGGLLVLTFAYVLNEARTHGLQGRPLIVRSSLLLTLGALYAAVIAMVAIAFLLPTLNPEDGLPASANVGPSILVFGAGSLALGLIVQVLWDSQPIIAPLSHADRVVEVDA